MEKIHHQLLLMHLRATRPRHSFPLTSRQESPMGKVTKLTMFGHPPSLLEAFFRYWCFQAGVHYLVTLLPWHHMASSCTIFSVPSPTLDSVLSLFSIKRHQATQKAPTMYQYCSRHHGCQDKYLTHVSAP